MGVLASDTVHASWWSHSEQRTPSLAITMELFKTAGTRPGESKRCEATIIFIRNRFGSFLIFIGPLLHVPSIRCCGDELSGVLQD